MPLFENDYLWTVQVPEMGNPGTKMGNLQQQLLCLMVHLLIPGRFIVLAERSRFLTILLSYAAIFSYMKGLMMM